jgi:DNA replication and repair protein RecF
MYLEELYLRCFRNYQEQTVNFQSQKTILVGNNAQGKSNLLESVELLSTLKSIRAKKDQDLIKEGSGEAEIKGKVKRRFSDINLSLILRQQGRKIISLNGEILKRNLDFLGSLNTVFFSSLDLDLVRGGPDYRRNWVDSLLLQLEPIYDYVDQQYHQVLRQRNAFLKQLKKSNLTSLNSLSLTNNSDLNLQLELWDQKLAETGSRVTRRRARALQRIAPLAENWHYKISNKTENLRLVYQPNVLYSEDDPILVQKAIRQQLEQHRIVELNYGSTIVGPHRDEILFKINDTPVRSFASQGQQRTLVLALKLAELELIEQVIGEPPLLLLDDVLAELDFIRQNHLLETLGDHFQTIITTTHLNSFDSNLLKEAQILEVENGTIKNK